jgi:hypothetical protein
MHGTTTSKMSPAHRDVVINILPASLSAGSRRHL